MSSAALQIPDANEATNEILAEVANDNNSSPALLRAVADREENPDQGEASYEAELAAADRALREAANAADRQAAQQRKAAACVSLATIKWERADLAGATKLYREAIHTFPEEAVAHRQRFAQISASALRRVGLPLARVDAAQAALNLLHEARVELSEQADVQHELGMAYATLGELTSSTDAFERARRAYDLALKAADKLQLQSEKIQAFRFRWRVQINQAVSFWQVGRLTDQKQLLAEAETLLCEVMRDIIKEVGHSDISEWPRALETLGLVMLAQGKVEEAIAAIKKARDAYHNPKDRLRALSNLLAAYNKGNYYESEEEEFNAAIKKIPEDKNPLAFGYVIHNKGLAIIKEASKLISNNEIKKGRELAKHAHAILIKAREKRRLEWSPPLWAATTAALGECCFLSGYLYRACIHYFKALIWISDIDAPKVGKRISATVRLINGSEINSRINYWMANRKKLFRDIEAVLSAHGEPRAEWRSIITDMMARWGARELLTPVTSDAATETSATPPLQLPDKAPKLYADRPKGQNIIDFLRDPDGWGPYVAAGLLSRPDLRRLDPQAYKAVENWLLYKILPPDIHLPKKKDIVDLDLSKIDTDEVRRTRRLLSARRRRAQNPAQ